MLPLDDHGHWRGCRQAVDECFARDRKPILLHRLEHAGRSGVKGSGA